MYIYGDALVGGHGGLWTHELAKTACDGTIATMRSRMSYKCRLSTRSGREV